MLHGSKQVGQRAVRQHVVAVGGQKAVRYSIAHKFTAARRSSLVRNGRETARGPCSSEVWRCTSIAHQWRISS